MIFPKCAGQVNDGFGRSASGVVHVAACQLEAVQAGEGQPDVARVRLVTLQRARHLQRAVEIGRRTIEYAVVLVCLRTAAQRRDYRPDPHVARIKELDDLVVGGTRVA